MSALLPSGRFAKAEPVAPGIARVLPNTYEVNELGTVVANNPHARWARGPLTRALTPVLSLTQTGSTMYDPSDPNHWVRAEGT